MEKAFQKLVELGEDEFKHLNEGLLTHFQGTKELLKQWGASDSLQNAGLYHAIYSTDSFNEQLISLEKREQVADIIGEEAENIVYVYCACDRRFFWPKIGFDEKPLFKNRFTNESYYISNSLLGNFCELTVANEVEIANSDNEFKHEHGEYLFKLFINMELYLSDAANSKVQDTFGCYG